jgi:hypothetical protein
MTTIMPKCFQCKHLFANQKGPNCEAFPDGIPMEILLNDFDHENAYPGDNGIRFEEGEPIGIDELEDEEFPK